MSQIDLTVTQNQYDTMMSVLNGIINKLNNNKVVLTRICSQEEGREKIKAFSLTDNGKWLREVNKFNNDLDDFFEDVGWRKN